jgi:molybdate transport system ATP-binding protein
MLSLAIRKALPGFLLDVAWDAGDEVVALFGPSGAGKTLTLQCLAGLTRPDAGRIVVNGRVFFDGERGVDIRPQARRLGYVFQGYALFPHLSVEDNVGFGLRDRPKAERRRRTREVMERLGLGPLARRRPRGL